MSVLSDLLAANRRYSEAFEGAELPATPRLAVAVLTCMDARIVPHRLLGLEEGDAHVLRNAAGRASGDALRSLLLRAGVWPLLRQHPFAKIADPAVRPKAIFVSAAPSVGWSS